jgi:putative ABC transport system permease protein
MNLTESGSADRIVDEITEGLAEFRGLEVEEADFIVFTSEQLLTAVEDVTSVFTSLLASIAAISLLVGGIGISNIMLVSVTERTREIGLRKAVGAQTKDILFQFLMEAVILTFVGGVIGIVLGIVLAFVIGAVAEIPATVSFSSILLATGVSILIGLIFGFAPANKAAQLDPIALRYE